MQVGGNEAKINDDAAVVAVVRRGSSAISRVGALPINSACRCGCLALTGVGSRSSGQHMFRIAPRLLCRFVFDGVSITAATDVQRRAAAASRSALALELELLLAFALRREFKIASNTTERSILNG